MPTPTDPNMAQAWISGTPPDQTIDFYIPRGNTGPTGPVGPVGPSLAVGAILTTSGPAAPGTVGAQGLTGLKGDPGGFAASTVLTNPTSFDTVITSGLYFNPQANSTAAPGPAATGGHLEVIGAASYIYQRYVPMGENRGVYTRIRTSSGTWLAWRVTNATRVDQTAGRAIYQWDDVNNREQLLYGDTGLRNINTLVNAALYDNTGIRNLYLRRTGQHVAVTGQLTSIANATGGQIAISLPNGFRCMTGGHENQIIQVRGNTALMRANMAAGLGDVAFYVLTGSTLGNSTTGDVFNVVMNFMTADVWPTTLPGTAVGSIPNV